MPYVVVRHKVEDYARWKPVFDSHAATRRANGSKGGYLFRNADNPDEVIILLEWDNLEQARAFAQSDDLRESMLRSGVSDMPDVYFVDEADRPAM